MSTKNLIMLFILFSTTLNAQFLTPELVINTMPVIPFGTFKPEIREPFLKNVFKQKTELEEEITYRKNITKENTKNIDDQAGKKMMEQMGYSVSPGDIQKMKNASKEQKIAMAQKMMQQNMNMSIDEAQKVSKMSKEGQKAWAEGMSTEMMAEAQSNPDKNKALQKNNMNMYEMVQEQSQLAQKIQGSNQKLSERLDEFNKLKEKTKLEYEASLKRIDKEMENKINSSLGDDYYETLKKQKETLYANYCGYLTPKYKDILSDQLTTLISLGDDYNRLDVLTNEITIATTGNKKKICEPGITYLEALLAYVFLLEDIP